MGWKKDDLPDELKASYDEMKGAIRAYRQNKDRDLANALEGAMAESRIDFWRGLLKWDGLEEDARKEVSVALAHEMEKQEIARSNTENKE